LSVLAIFLAGVLLRASDLNSRTFALVHATLFAVLFAAPLAIAISIYVIDGTAN
jgi:hypothetical protein